MSEFIHLHIHSQYSFLDAALLLQDLIPRIKQQNMNAVALTDHGNMCGVVDFYSRAKKESIKPIIGCELYVADDMHNKSKRDSSHLVLLAKNNIGYKNLMYLVSKGHVDGFYYNPRIDFNLLKEKSEGLIALTACLGGIINKPFLMGDVDKAVSRVEMMKEIMEPESFYLELQRTGYPNQDRCNDFLCEMSEKYNLPVVATNDAHYLESDHALIREVLINIRNYNKKNDDSYGKDSVGGMYLRSPEEMAGLFKDIPEAIENTVKIAEMCNVELDLDVTYLPRFPDAGDVGEDEYLEKLSRENLKNITKDIEDPELVKVYEERLETELEVIKSMGFSGYFLIVSDFINYAKKNNVSVGPGRGSGAGSLVALTLGIHELDPIKYDLLFERFLNKARQSMPDFDIDFCPRGRDKVIDYVINKYGQDKVSQIITFFELQPRSAVRDVARVENLPAEEINSFAKLVPVQTGKSTSLLPPPSKDKKSDKVIYALEDPKLKEALKKNPKYQHIIGLASKLGGCFRQTGVHAGGVVISDKPLHERVPLFRSKESIVTAFSKEEVERAGLVKFDFLGLKNLTVIHDAVNLINQKRSDDDYLDIEKIPLDDKKTYHMLSKGDTLGVFQLEGGGMTRMVKDLKPDRFEDLIAAVALYRPGPMESGMMKSYVLRKHKKERVESFHPLLNEVTNETYGVMVYQEQIMRSAQVLAGFSLNLADNLRRAMSKKKLKQMEELKVKFVEGAEKNGVKPEQASAIFEKIEKFAGYGFNKSHSAAYALISYRTAWLKANYPLEFYAALISSSMDNPDKLTLYLNHLREKKIKIEPPDINKSMSDFTVAENAIRFGLTAIKGVGNAAIEEIIKVREKESEPFSGLYDLTSRINPQKVNRKALELLIKAGAFDSINDNRHSLFKAVDSAVESGQSAYRDRKSGQNSLFGGSVKKKTKELYPAIEPWNNQEKLSVEYQTLGFYLSAHPLDSVRNLVKRFSTVNSENMNTVSDKSEASLVGVITSVEERVTRSDNSKRYISFTLLDTIGTSNIMVFTKTLREIEKTMKKENSKFETLGEKLKSFQNKATPVYVKGMVLLDYNQNDDTPEAKLSAFEITTLNKIKSSSIAHVTINLPTEIDNATLTELKGITDKYQGEVPYNLRFRSNDGMIIETDNISSGIKPTAKMLDEVKELMHGIVSEEPFTLKFNR